MNMRTYTHLIALGLLALLAYASATYAGTATTTFGVTATVDPTCSVFSGGDLRFGMYSGSGRNATTTVRVVCNNGATYSVGLDNGLWFNGHRQMKHNTSDFLQYELYNNSTRTIVWNLSSGLVPGTGTGFEQILTVYGRIPGGQNPPLGDYTDTIEVTVNY